MVFKIYYFLLIIYYYHQAYSNIESNNK